MERCHAIGRCYEICVHLIAFIILQAHILCSAYRGFQPNHKQYVYTLPFPREATFLPKISAIRSSIVPNGIQTSGVSHFSICEGGKVENGVTLIGVGSVEFVTASVCSPC